MCVYVCVCVRMGVCVFVCVCVCVWCRRIGWTRARLLTSSPPLSRSSSSSRLLFNSLCVRVFACVCLCVSVCECVCRRLLAGLAQWTPDWTRAMRLWRE